MDAQHFFGLLNTSIINIVINEILFFVLKLLNSFRNNAKSLLFNFRPEKLEIYDTCGTVQDLVVSLLCGNDKVIMSTQNAASWGYFCTEETKWEIQLMSDAGLPVKLLPQTILHPGQNAGQLIKTWFGIPAGVPIGNIKIICYNNIK